MACFLLFLSGDRPTHATAPLTLANDEDPMDTAMHDYIQRLPKAELHVHLEGTLEPEHIFSLAQRNGIELEYETPQQVIDAYDFHDLPSFLKIYYAAMDVLRTEDDFYELTMAYFRRAAAQHVIYVEPFFDPQAHTSRGIAFDTVINGIARAQEDAARKLGVKSNLIMCFLRDMSASSAAEHLDMARPHLDKLIGVGLDSDEEDNPPSKFAEVFARARDMGLKLTMHCDVNQKDIHAHIRECLDLIQVDRIDHGVNALEDEALAGEIAERGLGLTVCPVSNRFVVQNLTGDEIRDMLRRGIKATINSDDPAYFRAYMNENLQALADEAAFTREELFTLTRNAFEVCWAGEDDKKQFLERLEQAA
jgi:adenosine deaminase